MNYFKKIVKKIVNRCEEADDIYEKDGIIVVNPDRKIEQQLPVSIVKYAEGKNITVLEACREFNNDDEDII